MMINKKSFSFLGKSFLIIIIILFLISSANAAANSERAAVRDMPEKYSKNSPVNVKIHVQFSDVDCDAALIEDIPPGWSASNIQGKGDGYYNSVHSTIIWAPISGPSCGGKSSYELSYNLLPSAISLDQKTLSGSFSVDGKIYSIEGDEIISPSGSTPVNFSVPSLAWKILIAILGILILAIVGIKFIRRRAEPLSYDEIYARRKVSLSR